MPILRDTPFTRKQMALLKDAFQEARQSPFVEQLWRELVQMMQEIRRREDMPDPDVEARFADMEMRVFFVRVSLLECAMCEQTPALAHALGPHLRRWLLAALAIAAFGEGWPTWAQFIYRCLPDLPVIRQPDGSYTGVEQMDFKKKHHLQLKSLITALRPARDRGRPRKDTTSPVPMKATRLDPVLPAQPYALQSDGVHWRRIARALYPGCQFNDEAERERMRQHIRRLIERGRLNAGQSHR